MDIPNGFAERLRQVEKTVSQQGTDLARIDAQTSSNTEMIRALAPLISQLATVAEAQRNLQMGMDDLKHEWRDDVKHFDDEVDKITSSQEREVRDAQAYRRTVYVMLVAALLSPIGSVLVVLITNK